MIPIYEPDLKKYKLSAIKAINDGWISNHGEFIKKSTDKLNEIMKTKYSILINNGTSATHCLFLALKYKYPNIDKIYMPNNVYIAAWNAALMVYNISNLILMKMDNDTWNIDVSEEYILSLEENSAMLIVHNLGNIINVPKLKELRPDIIFIEDNCEGFTGKYNNIYSGTSDSSLSSSISFYGNKIITTGEGGAFITQHKDIYDYIIKVYSQGMSNIRYLHDVHAYNYRMTNIEAAFLYDQLNDLDTILKNKQNIFNNYKTLLKPLITENKIKLFKVENNIEPANWLFPIRILNNTKSIEDTNDFFIKNGVDIRPFFYPINKHNHLKELENNDEVSYLLNNEIIMIPSSPNITYHEQKKVINIIVKYLLFNLNLNIIEINSYNINLLNEFIIDIKNNDNNDKFRYYNNRNISIIANHIITILLFDIENIPIGYLHIDYNNNKYWLGIYIKEKFRNKKIGDLLIKYVLTHKKLNYILKINLTVDKDNENAIKLYKNNGFTIINNDDDDTNTKQYYSMEFILN
jgi:perosamine synthetase